jgi:anti-sigma-K factor RskA
MSRCPEKTEWVLYAAGEVPAGSRTALEAHLAACEACRSEVATLRSGLAEMEILDRDAPLRPEAVETLGRRLRAAAAHTPARKPLVLVLWHYRWAAAAAVLVAAALAWPLIQGPTPTAPPVISPQATAPAKIQWVPDTEVQEEITEIAAGVEMLEGGYGGTLCEAEPAPPRAGGDESLDEMDRMIEMLQAEGDA